MDPGLRRDDTGGNEDGVESGKILRYAQNDNQFKRFNFNRFHMAHHEPVTVDPNTQHHAEGVWHNFIQWLKYGAIGVAGLLIVMALTLL